MKVRSFVKKSIRRHDVQFQDQEFTTLEKDELLVRVTAVGLCGSDLHMYAGHSGYDWVDFPLVLGHEVTGVIKEVGTAVDNNLLGKRVVINPYIACGSCKHCSKGNINRCEFGKFSKEKNPSKALQYGFRKPGGLAEYMKVNKDNILFLNNPITDAVAAISEGLAVSYTGLVKVQGFKNKRILVVGPGPIGLGVAAILIGYSNKQVHMLGTKNDQERLKLAKHMGVSKTYSNWEEIERNSNTPFDAIIDCSGHYSIPGEGIKWLDRGGDIVLLGISNNKFSLPMDQIVRGEIVVKGSYGITLENYKKVLKMAGNIAFPFNQIVSEVIPFDNIKEGFNKALNHAPGKIVIKI